MNSDDKQFVQVIIIILLLIMLMLSTYYWGYTKGERANQQAIENRAKDAKFKDCYDWQDIEIIIFGQIQE
jgi:Tfp pilus assembly protein PilO